MSDDRCGIFDAIQYHNVANTRFHMVLFISTSSTIPQYIIVAYHVRLVFVCYKSGFYLQSMYIPNGIFVGQYVFLHYDQTEMLHCSHNGDSKYIEADNCYCDGQKKLFHSIIN